MGVVYNGVTVKGRTYNNGDTFTSAASGTWYGSSDGGNGSGSIPKGCTVTFIGYQNDYNWQKVHYIVKSSSFNGNYQCWTSDAIFPDNTSYTISYNMNGGTPAIASQTKTYGTSIKLSTTVPERANGVRTTYRVTFNANGGSCSVPYRDSNVIIYYGFAYWSSSYDNNTYLPGDTYSTNASTTLTANWSNADEAQLIYLPSSSDVSRSGYEFLGWSTSSTATSATYNGGASYRPSENITFYAVWQELPKTSLINYKNGTSFSQGGLVRIKSGNEWVIATKVKLRAKGEF